MLNWLQRGSDLPSAYMFNPSPAMRTLQARYGEAINELQRRYESTIKPLNTDDNRREWSRMCGNYQSGIHPITGKPDRAFPALDQPVTRAEREALLKPAARAAYDAERRLQAQRSEQTRAQYAAQVEASEARVMQAQQRIVIYGAAAIGLAAFAVLSVAWMLWMLARTHWRAEAASGRVRLRSKTWAVHDLVGVVLHYHKHLETVVTGGGGGGANNAPVTVSISSHTIVHQDIRVGTADGGQQDVRLRNWNIGVNEGDLLQCSRLVRGDRESPYLLVLNRSTKRHWVIDDFLYRQLIPMNGLLALLLVLVTGSAIAALSVGGVGALAFLMPELTPSRGVADASIALALSGWLFGFLWMWRARRKALRATREVVTWLLERPPPTLDLSES